MKNFLRLFALILLVVAAGCSKTKDPVVKNDQVTPSVTSAVFTWEVEFDGDIASMVELSQSSDMAQSQRYGSDVVGADKSFEVTVDNLADDCSYYYRYLVTDGQDTYTMETKTFKTLAASLPSVSPVTVGEVTMSTADCRAEITSDGGSEVTERGFCWSNEEEPDMDDNVLVEGAGTGSYTLQLTNLRPARVYYVRAYAKNIKGVALGAVTSFETAPPPVVPTVNSTSASFLDYTAVECQGEILSNGGDEVTDCGFCWSTDPEPVITGNHQSAGAIQSGAFTVAIRDLDLSKKYYLRAYAFNSVGVSYGETLNYDTPDGLASLSACVISDITSSSAEFSAEVTDGGASEVTERGICLSRHVNPNVLSLHVIADVAGTGEFSCRIADLDPETVYYVCAYAINSQGVSYGEIVSFTTQMAMPEVETMRVTDITQTTAIGWGKVVNSANHVISERGICWSLDSNPTIEDAHGCDPNLGGLSTKVYSVNMSDLTPGSKYSVRAYVIIEDGVVVYGNEQNFFTEAK